MADFVLVSAQRTVKLGLVNIVEKNFINVVHTLPVVTVIFVLISVKLLSVKKIRTSQ